VVSVGSLFLNIQNTKEKLRDNLYYSQESLKLTDLFQYLIRFAWNPVIEFFFKIEEICLMEEC